MKRSMQNRIRRYAFYFGGDLPNVDWGERIRSCGGALVGLMLVLVVAKLMGEFADLEEWLTASLGASALLVFALPGSPIAQPWAVIAGIRFQHSLALRCIS